jgi:carbon monoxide dehydrogenase subunit G
VKVQLDKSFPLPAGADAAWEFLHNLEAVVPCMPGAAITERVDERHFKGTVSVRVGPASLSFRGDVEIKELDPATRTLRLLAKGTDSTGGSGASMDLTARIEPAGDASNLVGSSQVSMSGKAAAFGGRMLDAVADQVLEQFADNFAAQVASQVRQTAAAPPRELNGLALMWAVFKNWVRAVFGKISGKSAA